MLRFPFVRLVSAVLAANLASAASDAAGQEMWLEASIECRLWLEARGEGSAGPYEAYLIGMLDGMSVIARADFWGESAGRVQFGRGAAFGFVDAWCVADPDGDVLGAAQAMFAQRTGGSDGQAL
jgi:hypothetical protein